MLEPNFTPFPDISTNRLLLRRLVKEDADAILSLRSNDDVMQFIDREKITTREQALGFIKIIDDALETNNGIHWTISLAGEPGTLIGIIGFWRLIKQHYRAEIGYMLQPAYWGQGIMKEAIEPVIRYGFERLQLHSIEAHINPGNKASAALLEKTGFIREAYFREDYFFRGRFIDTAIYSLLSR